MYGITLIVDDDYGDESGDTQYIYIGTNIGVGTPTPNALNESLAPGFEALTPSERATNLNFSINEASLLIPGFAVLIIFAIFTGLFGRVKKGMTGKK
jgi:hypothetical protein